MKTVSLLIIWMAAGMVSMVFADEQTADSTRATVPDARVSAEAETTPMSADSDNPMLELCQSYAEDEDIASAERATHVTDCLSSMTDLSDTLQAGEQDAPLVAVPTEAIGVQTESHPEDLIADELVEVPAPGVEQLVAGSAAKEPVD